MPGDMLLVELYAGLQNKIEVSASSAMWRKVLVRIKFRQTRIGSRQDDLEYKHKRC